MTEENKLDILPSNCDCEICSGMCKGPCCGTPDEIRNLMKLGYGKRLMRDNWPGGPDLVKLALKGHEGKKAPWETITEEGCTFWRSGKCELHDLGLKPLQGQLAHHAQSCDQQIAIGKYISDFWENEDVKDIFEEWKRINSKRKKNG